MSASACIKLRFENDDRYERIGHLYAKLHTIGDLSQMMPELSTTLDNQYVNGQNGKIIVVHDERDQHIVAFLSVNDSRDGLSFIHSAKFDYDALSEQCGQNSFLEIGEIGILDARQSHRARALIWQLVFQYCNHENISYVVGCFAFSGRYPAMHALALSYLYHFYRAEPATSVPAHKGVSMDIMPQEAIRVQEAQRLLPAQLRYCLRHGAKVGENIFVDMKTNQSEIFILMPVAKFLNR